jgi:hypothetical protein
LLADHRNRITTTAAGPLSRSSTAWPKRTVGEFRIEDLPSRLGIPYVEAMSSDLEEGRRRFIFEISRKLDAV